MKNLLYSFVFLFILSSGIAQPTVELELFANGFSAPVDIRNTGVSGDTRLFIVEQGGIIKIVQPNGNVNPVAFLNISSLVSNGGEQGLLGLAFHPDYGNNGFFYVNYTDTNGDTQVSRFSVSAGDPDIADPGSEFPIIDYTQPFSNHNGGCVAFGPDGYLYISSGDGGSGGDPGNRAQNTTLLLGKLLRIDVDNPSGGNNYGIPPDNPFAGSTVNAQEIWAYGLRNPWRFSFDSLNGDIWIGDVGQGDVEEIDHAFGFEDGLNYGWRCYEGSMPFNTTGCPPIGDLTFPITEYSSSTGSGNCSVTGGYVNRSPAWPQEAGIYYFADVCSGRIWTYDIVTNTTIDHGSFGGSWVSFGVDVNEQLYISDIGGDIFKITGTLLGTSDIDALQVSILPNPASDLVNISIESGIIASVTITDLKGAKLLSEENIQASEKNISLSGLSKGLYLVRIISTGNTMSVKKLIVK